MDIDLTMVAEYDNPKGLSTNDLFQDRLDQLNTMDRTSFTQDQLKEIKEEIRHLCHMLLMIEVCENEQC